MLAPASVNQDQLMLADILEDLKARGLMVQSTDEQVLAEHLQAQPRTLYCGFDPTADSLHIGNLVPLLVLKRFQLAGHRPILLLGGATGLIGDPSGKSEERNLHDQQTVAGFVEKIRAQTKAFLSYEGDQGAIVVNNLDWTAQQDVVYFLREIGKHFSVNMMMQRESIRARLEREDQGISYTEFSYMLLQANDFYELFNQYGCTLQVGGNDQWGNIVSGVDLVRRKCEAQVHALTLPLITKADGTKFGKTAGGSIWLDSAKTSPYTFYQFWLNTADADVVHYLKVFTLLPMAQIQDLEAAVAQAPGQRQAQKRLAEEVTELVHGPEAVAAAKRITEALFTGAVAELAESDLQSLQQDGMSATQVSDERLGLLSLISSTGLAASNGAARKLVASGGVSVNGEKVTDPSLELDWTNALYGRFYVLRKGKKTWHLASRA
ncbi:MAG: tyrosine--tRNA ligase [Pseudomonadales bacterium]